MLFIRNIVTFYLALINSKETSNCFPRWIVYLVFLQHGQLTINYNKCKHYITITQFATYCLKFECNIIRLSKFSWIFTNNFNTDGQGFFHYWHKNGRILLLKWRIFYTIIDLYNTNAAQVKCQAKSKIMFFLFENRNTTTIKR